MPRRVWEIFRTRLLGGFAWNLVVATASQGSLFLAHLVVARTLGVSEFGHYALLLTTAMAVSAIAQSGVGFVAAKYVAEYHLTAKARTGRVLSMCRFSALALGTVCSLALVLGAPSAATLLFGEPALAQDLRLLSLSIPLLALNAYQLGALQGFGAFRQSGLAAVASGIVHVTGATIGALLGGLEGILVALVLSAAIRCWAFAVALSAIQTRHKIETRFFGFTGDIHLLWRIGLPSALMGASSSISLWLVNVMLAQGPAGPDGVGQFYAANQLRLLALQLPTILTGVSVSVLNRLRGESDKRSYKSVYVSNLVIGVGIGAVLASVLVSLSTPLLTLYGSGFTDATALLRWLAMSILFELTAIALYLHVQAQERLWLPFYAIWLPKELLFVCVTALLLEGHPAVAAGIAYVASSLFAAIAFSALVVRIGFGTTERKPEGI